jgi:hypothetical protein
MICLPQHHDRPNPDILKSHRTVFKDTKAYVSMARRVCENRYRRKGSRDKEIFPAKWQHDRRPYAASSTMT